MQGRRVECLPDFFVHGLSKTRLPLSALYVPLLRTGFKARKCINNDESLERTESPDGGV